MPRHLELAVEEPERLHRSMIDLENPLRHPDVSSPSFMTKRAWWLLILSIFLPGGAQAIAGNQKLGRVGLVTTLSLWTLVILGVAGLMINQSLVIGIVSQAWALWLIQIFAVAYVVIWLVMLVDTVRLLKLVRVGRRSRVGILTTSLVTIAAVLFAGVYVSNVAAASRGALGTIFVASGPTVEPVDGRYNILLLGGDAGPDREGLRPDSISLVSVNAETGQSVIVGLPRELQNMPFPESSPMYPLHPNGYAVDICELDVCYLNSLYTDVSINHSDLYPDAEAAGSEPGIEAVKDAVTGATGLEVQFFVMVDMAGFEALIDALGGIEIAVLERLPIGGDEFGNNVDGYIEPGVQVMNGYTALWYARSRYSTNDYDRMRRQREIQTAILQQFTPATVATRFVELAAAGSNLVRTDIPESMVPTFIDLALKSREFEPVTVELTPPEVDPFYPDYAMIQEMVSEAVLATSALPEEQETP